MQRTLPTGARLSTFSRIISAVVLLLPASIRAGESVVPSRQSSAALFAENRPSAELFATGSQQITLERAIQMALENNLEVKFERVGISIQRARVQFEAGVFDPTFSISSTNQSVRRLENINDVRSADVIRQEQAISSNFALAQAQQNLVNTQRELSGLPPIDLPALNRDRASVGISDTTFSLETIQNESGLVGRTPWGMRYGFQFQANRIRNTFTGDVREVIPEYQTLAQLTVVQPLLRNFGTDVNLTNLRVERVNRKIQVLEWRERVEAAVQGVMSAYYEMLYGMQDIRVREDAIAAGQKLVDLYRRRVELGFNSPIDIQQAEVAVSIDRENLLLSRNTFLERQYLLKRLILDEFERTDARILVPVAAPMLPAPKLDRTRLLSTAYERRHDYLSALLGAEVQNLRVRFAKNQLLPQLDLIASYGLNGLGTGFGDSFDQGLSGRTPTWSVGVNFSVPLGNVQARAQHAITLGQKEQALLRIKQTEITVGVDVDTIISRIETNRQRVTTAVETRRLAEETVRVAYRRLEEGLISSFDIIDFQRQLYDAKSRELTANSDLNKSISQLWLVTGTVAERTGVQFREPPEPRPRR